MHRNSLITPGQKILLAVSGGVDSVVMAELFHQAGYRFAMAHCNFGLRAHESDADELFVSALAKNRYETDFFTKRFDTLEYAKQHKLSVQEAARNLRYNWFEEIREQHAFNFIATAHHIDDQIETFFINLLRGTGIAGLTGIALKQNHIIRPMLFATRSEIAQFALQFKLTFRNDSSNQSDKYLRNNIRHNLVPMLNHINPNYSEAITHTISLLNTTETIYRNYLESVNPIETDKSGLIRLSLPKLQNLQPMQHFLYEFIAPYGFNASDCNAICSHLNGISGKQFFSATHQLLKNRDHLLIEPLADAETEDCFIVDPKCKTISAPIHLQLSKHKKTKKTNLKTGKDIAMVDFDKVKFPLILRKWKKGDYFCPLGMKTRMKLSDFFISNKISRFDKSKIWLLCSDNMIVWVVGHRLDERFRVHENTQFIYKIAKIE